MKIGDHFCSFYRRVCRRSLFFLYTTKSYLASAMCFLKIFFYQSNVWTFFIKCDTGGKCKLCQQTVKTIGNTTNLTNHLKRHHKEAYIDINKSLNESGQSSTSARVKMVSTYH